MCKHLEYVKFEGTLIGTIWWPRDECTKEFEVKFTPDDQPFSHLWEGMYKALDRITNDGDFQSCDILECSILVQWIDTDPVTKRSNTIRNWYALPEVLINHYNN